MSATGGLTRVVDKQIRLRSRPNEDCLFGKSWCWKGIPPLSQGRREGRVQETSALLSPQLLLKRCRNHQLRPACRAFDEGSCGSLPGLKQVAGIDIRNHLAIVYIKFD
jgi:hypothetical protein